MCRALCFLNTPMDSELDFLLQPSSQFDRMLKQESGNQQYGKDGQPLTSSAGARGIAQVMPGTGPEAAKLAGVDWNPELFNRARTGDPVKDSEAENYNRTLGRAYYQEQLRVFGDPNIASAAYNAGPGAVRLALSKAKATGGNYLDYLPAETQHYVGVVGGGKTSGRSIAASGSSEPEIKPEPVTINASPPSVARPTKRDPLEQFFADLQHNATVPLPMAGIHLPEVEVRATPGLEQVRNLQPEPVPARSRKRT